ncbi:hypothetical protein [Streptomyces radiopugnans]|uniref:Uncharacterized protein n=1 Tax=Streptomyces radiopugnans TaxID=403935 RepID=A0A1H9CUC9_9ACTN|nr:hypothetical protein [Streptomyces radiopugnans]SEQ04759.1 hypothetical protein SAMN05216481_103440 [Streptomyces radiopugnans]
MIETAVSVFQLLFGLLFLGVGWDGWRRPGEASLPARGRPRWVVRGRAGGFTLMGLGLAADAGLELLGRPEVPAVGAVRTAGAALVVGSLAVSGVLRMRERAGGRPRLGGDPL